MLERKLACKQCGQMFTPRAARHELCSDDCRSAWKTAYDRNYAKENALHARQKAREHYHKNREADLLRVRDRYTNDPAYRERSKERSIAARLRQKANDPDIASNYLAK